MSSIRRLALAATLALATGAGFAAGASAAGEIGGRFDNQHRRIVQGYDNGSLTKDEACHLLRQEHQMTREREHEGNHGMSQREREGMNRDLNRESHLIREDRHNDRDGRGHRSAASLHC